MSFQVSADEEGRPARRRVGVPRNAPSSEEVGLSDIGAILARRKLTIALCTLAGLGLGGAYSILAPVQYQASASILIDPRLGRIVGADPSAPGFVADSSSIDSQVKLLTAQTVLTRVGAALKLQDDEEFNGQKGGILAMLGLKSPTVGGIDLKALENAITIKRPERTYLVEIQASAHTAEKAAALANAVADAYNEDQISSRVVSARNDAKFVDQKRAALQKQILDAEHRIEAYKAANHIVVGADGSRSNEQQVADLTRELGASRGRLSELKARADQAERIARTGQLDASADALKSLTIERLRSSQADIERERAKLSETLGPRHPARLESEAQSQRVRELISTELKRLQTGAENDYRTEKQNEAQLLREIDRLKGQSNDTSSKLVPMKQMEREVEALRASDERFARVSDTLSQQEGDTPPARLVAAARPPVSPASPKRKLALALGTAAGLFVGLGLALALGANRARPDNRPRRFGDETARAPERDYWSGAPDGTADRPPRRNRAPVRRPLDDDADAYWSNLAPRPRNRAGERAGNRRHGRLIWP